MRKAFCTILIFLTLVSCLFDSEGRGGHKRIKDFSIGAKQEDNEDTFCTSYYFPTENTCHKKKCPKGSHEGTDEEIAGLKENFEQQAEDEEIEEEFIDEIRANLEHAKVICIGGSGVLRPDKAVFINSNFCACYNNSPIMVGNCSFYCDQLQITGEKRDTETLYGSVQLGPQIELSKVLGHLYGWCEELIPGSDYTNPGCKFVVQSPGGSNYNLPITVRTNNTFTVDISGLRKGETYIGKIGEVESGARVFSDNIQFRLIDPPEEREISTGPLKIAPISQYSCVTRRGQYSPTLNEAHYNAAFKRYYYISADTTPAALDEAQSDRGTKFCHDIVLYGPKDSPRYERLELIPQHFALWDASDIRFSDQDKDQSMDINKAVSQKLFKDFGIRENFDLFIPLNAHTGPAVENESLLGYRMKFWIRPNSTETFCPTQKDYYGNAPIFNVLKDYVGIDTEGIYAALRETITLPSEDQEIPKASPNLMYIRESELKSIWFIIENGQLLRPDENNLDSKAIMFYWPPDPYAPYTKKLNQRRYTVVGSDPSVEVNGTLQASDKKLGCIPVSN